MYVGAAAAGFLFLLFASVALWWALGNLLDSRGWAAVIVAVVWAIVAILAAVAKKALEETKGLPKTADTVGKIPNALKGQKEKKTSTEPEQIRADIERTRAALSENVNALADEANPKNIAKRQVNKVKEAGVSVKDRIMEKRQRRLRRRQRQAVVGGRQVVLGWGHLVGHAGSAPGQG